MSRSAVEQAYEALSRTREFDDPWLLSYADLVTNLLAFFVLLVSMATISFETIDALPTAFSSKARTEPNLKTLSTDVKQLVESEGLTGQVLAQLDTEGLAIAIQDKIVFDSGKASLSGEGGKLVEKIARLLNKLPERYHVVVEGHTDDVPIATAQFPSNWELSAARALQVRRELSKAGVEEKRIAITAFADTRPLPPEETDSREEQRRKNRRVVIRVH
jgi:chemotaxis protein MotB